ncbi:MAG: MBL fold metallo-hydrolase, partial [Deltaproteobacteria bacterium]|nr:MBL fold metallo-hydrolase [Deltaproteobacteria bacterium]
MAHAQGKFEKDVIKTKAGDLEITFIGHGTLMFTFGGKVVHVDPVGQYADYSKLPKADLILITHEHGDHLDLKVVAALRQPGRLDVGQDPRVVGVRVGRGAEV